MDASNLPKGKSSEVSNGRQNPPGIYRHKDTGAEFITSDGNDGSIQADALLSPVWKDGWEWIGEVPSRVELLERQKTQQIKEATEATLAKEQEDKDLVEAKKVAVEAARKAKQEPVATTKK